MASKEAIDKIVSNLHWLGHDCFRLDRPGGGPVYWDPYQIKGGPTASLILISHDHFDHCSPEDVAKIQGPDTVIVTEANAASKLSGKVKVVGPNHSLGVGDLKIMTVPAYNVDKAFHPRGNGWLGFMLIVDGVRIYHAGDTDYIQEMDMFTVDMALLPVSGTYVMTADEAVNAALAIGPQLAIPMHYGSIVGGDDDAKQFQKGLEGMIPVKILPRES
ncbi:MAG: MBL fold metallo-hydrolase [Deltaproteobacteria bacterium]|nr:MBL fold metallo-hydrolase [Deltaproteobacteria bacterium]